MVYCSSSSRAATWLCSVLFSLLCGGTCWRGGGGCTVWRARGGRKCACACKRRPRVSSTPLGVKRLKRPTDLTLELLVAGLRFKYKCSAPKRCGSMGSRERKVSCFFCVFQYSSTFFFVSTPLSPPFAVVIVAGGGRWFCLGRPFFSFFVPFVFPFVFGCCSSSIFVHV